jgi:Amt family ammonium transporter
MRCVRTVTGWGAGLSLALASRVALAQEAGAAPATPIDSGDIAWMLTSSAIVLMMTVPGLALFYGGLVRSKNVLSILMQCFMTLAIVSVIWVLWGYSIAFGPDSGNGLWGDLSLFALAGVSHEVVYPGLRIPAMAFMVFQLMFAVITPALITGAYAERMKFSAFLLFTVLWSTLIYSPLAHWVWGGGWLMARGALDFAGGTVVHISSGVSALVAAAMIGRRRGHGERPMPPHNLPFTVLGASLLWVGWFGFNAGSAGAANGTAVLAFVTTNTATAAAVIGWVLTEWIGKGKPTALGAASGAVAGLVAITPAAGFVTPGSALLIGLVAGALCYKACNFKERLGYDDALDVVGVHGVGGTWGALATGLFATTAANAAGKDGLFYGNPDQLLTQLIGVVATYALAGFGSFVILGLVNSVVGLRVSEEDEEGGLDLALHSENAYATAPSGAIGEFGVPQRRERVIERPSPRPERATPAPRPPAAPTATPPPVRRTPPPTPPPAAAAPRAPGPMGAGDRRFDVVVDGIDRGWVTRWWRELCTQDVSKAPPPFREIYPNVVSFEGGVFTFRGGDPGGTRDRLAYLLDMYGAHDAQVRVEEVH